MNKTKKRRQIKSYFNRSFDRSGLLLIDVIVLTDIKGLAPKFQTFSWYIQKTYNNIYLFHLKLLMPSINTYIFVQGTLKLHLICLQSHCLKYWFKMSYLLMVKCIYKCIYISYNQVAKVHLSSFIDWWDWLESSSNHANAMDLKRPQIRPDLLNTTEDRRSRVVW